MDKLGGNLEHRIHVSFHISSMSIILVAFVRRFLLSFVDFGSGLLFSCGYCSFKSECYVMLSYYLPQLLHFRILCVHNCFGMLSLSIFSFLFRSLSFLYLSQGVE